MSNNDLKIPYLLHIKKMDCFKLATQNIARVEDLLLLLIFENLGASLIRVDFEKPDWQKHVTWNSMKDALNKKRESHKQLKALTKADYDSLRGILRKFKSPQFVNDFVEFRDRITHRFNPSVDYPELYSFSEKRTGETTKTASGLTKTTWSMPSRPNKPEYEFLKLYELARQTFGHWVSLLEELRAIPRFGPNATISDS